jgi:hypothetical protein
VRRYCFKVRRRIRSLEAGYGVAVCSAHALRRKTRVPKRSLELAARAVGSIAYQNLCEVSSSYTVGEYICDAIRRRGGSLPTASSVQKEEKRASRRRFIYSNRIATVGLHMAPVIPALHRNHMHLRQFPDKQDRESVQLTAADAEERGGCGIRAAYGLRSGVGCDSVDRRAQCGGADVSTIRGRSAFACRSAPDRRCAGSIRSGSACREDTCTSPVRCSREMGN